MNVAIIVAIIFAVLVVALLSTAYYFLKYRPDKELEEYGKKLKLQKDTKLPAFQLPPM
tara:strand:- start:1012 stop:1185 length:174 start_codon:yes stop_codon:yes gene_type:complete